MQLARVFKKSKYLITFVFPFLLLLGVVSILFGESHTSFVFSILLPPLVLLNIFQFIFQLIKRKKKVIYNLAVLLLFFLCFDSFYQLNSNNNKETTSTVSILTYNVQGYKSKARSSKKNKIGIADFIMQTNADIVCIQEFSAIEYHSYKTAYPHWIKSNMDVPHKSVMGVFSKFPFVKNGYIEFPDSKNNTMFVDINIRGKIFRLYNLHLESYNTETIHQLDNIYSYKPLIRRIFKADKIRAAQAKLVREHINSFDGDVIILGDFNSTQYSPVYRILKEDRKDTFTEAGNGLGSTFQLFDFPFKVDHILVDESFEIINHQNFDINLSDHEPVLAEIKFKD